MNHTKTQVYQLLAILLFWLPYTGIAQNYLPYIQKFTLEDGLSSPYFNSFLQDSRGIIWLGTNYGLNRYDGAAIKSYTKEDDGLCHNYVRGISEDGNGNLWVLAGDYTRSQQFFCVFDPISEVFYTVEEYTGAPCPFDPSRTNLSPLYKGILLLSEETDSTYHIFEVDKNRLSLAFSISRSDSFYQSFVSNDVVKLDNGNFLATTVRYEQHVTQKNLFNSRGEILEDFPCGQAFGKDMQIAAGHLFYSCLERCCTKDGSAIYTDPSIYIDGQKKGVIDHLSIEAVLPTKDHIYLIEGGRAAISIYDQKSLALQQRVALEQKIANTSNYWFADQGGGIWYRADNGICRLGFREQFFELPIQDDHSGKSKPIRGITTAPNGTVYTGGSLNRLYIHPRNEPKLETVVQESTSGGIMGLLYDEGVIWIALDSKKNLWRYSPETGESKFYDIQEGSSPQVLLWMPYKAPDGSLWVGGSKGILKLDTLTNKLRDFKDYNGFTELTTSSVYAFHRNDKGIWLSTSSGLYLADLQQEKILAHYSDTQPAPYHIPGNHIAHIYEDKQGIFWLATKGQGLIRWDPATGKSEQLNRKNTGLSHNVLYAVYEDDFGNLWLPSDRGLMRLNKESRQVTVYLEEDGLPHHEFNTIAHHRDQDGNLYFGTQDGSIRFHPKDLQQGQTDAPLIITASYRVNRKTDSLINETAQVIKHHSLTILPGDKAAEFSFALLDYGRPGGNEYSYKIEGYHNDWIYQKEGSVRFGGLPYGQYQLLLRAKASGSNTWVDYPQSIVLTFAKPFYLRWWFLLSSVLTIAGGILFWIKRKTRTLLARQQELETIVEERTEEIRQQAEELKVLDQVKSNFFANISHELRTPLTLILGPLSYLLDNPDEWEQANVRQQLHVMQRNGKSLMQLIEEILDLSKLEANKLELVEEATSVVQFVEYISLVFEPLFEANEIDFELEVKVREDLHLLVDRNKLEKVLNNLLSNALKFTPKKGKIILKVSETEERLKIQVSDTGKGIHPNDLPHIFERFYQSKQGDQKLYGGTGIGLALVSEFARLMGGKVYAESIQGVGSDFYFEFPKKEIAVAKILSQVPEEVLEDEPIYSIGTDFTILVVEDNPDMRAFIQQLLQKQYKRILLAQNGAEALAALAEHGTDIHLIISDIMMPEVDGLSMLREIKTNIEWNGIPVVMLTALAAERDRLAALTIGVDDYLTKPFSVPELLLRVQNLLYNYHQRSKWKTSAEYLEEARVTPPNKQEEQQIKAADKQWIDELAALIENTMPGEPPTIDSLARASQVSIRQLNRRMKAITGLTPARFIKEVQLKTARKKLEDGSFRSISEVAYQCGFQYPATFSTLFKNRFGKSPSDYWPG